MSISAIVIAPRFPLHHCLTSSGVVHALYTRCLGASNSRVMRICSSVGRVTVAVALLVVAIFLLLVLEVFQHDVQLVEPLGPGALVIADPVVDGLQCVAVEPVQPLASFVAHVNSSHLSQYPEV